MAKSRNDTYGALLQSSKADEQEAVAQRNAVDRVVEERRMLVASLMENLQKLNVEYQALTGSQRIELLQQGRVQQAASVMRRSEAVRDAIEQLGRKVQTAEEDLRRAKERLDVAEQELREVRVERKKAETLVSRREQQERIVEAAREELFVDELNSAERSKK